jgi:hypothetical protein
MFRYTEEMKEFLFQNYKGKSSEELVVIFNARFGTDREPKHMAYFRRNNKLDSGLTGYYEVGSTPWNKGTKGLSKPNKTSFKKGNRPYNYAAVGTEVMKADGYIWVKIAEPAVWKQKHRIIWEEANGPLPKNHILIFLDQNHENIRLDNIELITRKIHAQMNRRGFYSEDPEFTRAGLETVKLLSRVAEIEKMEEKK